MPKPLDQERLRALGSFMRNARDEQSFTLRELARLSGVAVSTISKLEMGRHEPSLFVFAALCGKMGLSMDDMLILVDEELRRKSQT